VQKKDWRAVSRPGFRVADAQQAGIDLFERCEGRVRLWLERVRGWRLRIGGLSRGGTERYFGSSNAYGSRHQKAATIAVDFFGHVALPSWRQPAKLMRRTRPTNFAHVLDHWQ